MNLSDIKKLVLEEKKIIVVDGDDALVVIAFDEYKRLKGKEPVNRESFPLNFQPIDFKEAASEGGEPQPDLSGQEKSSQDLTLDDLPF